MCAPPQQCALFRHVNFQKCSEPGVPSTFWLGNVLRATTTCTFSTSQLPKVVRTWCVLYILTWKCASRHSGAHFFHISTSKSVRNVRCFLLFHLQMCVAPQRRALFQHLNFQKCSKRKVPLKRAYSSTLRSHKSLERHSESRLFYLFAHLHLLPSHFFSSLIFSLLLFSSLTLPTSAFPSVHIVGSLTSKLPSINGDLLGI